MRKWRIANATSRVDVGDRLRFLVRVRCSRKESSRSLSHLLMSFLYLDDEVLDITDVTRSFPRQPAGDWPVIICSHWGAYKLSSVVDSIIQVSLTSRYPWQRILYHVTLPTIDPSIDDWLRGIYSAGRCSRIEADSIGYKERVLMPFFAVLV